MLCWREGWGLEGELVVLVVLVCLLGNQFRLLLERGCRGEGLGMRGMVRVFLRGRGRGLLGRRVERGHRWMSLRMFAACFKGLYCCGVLYTGIEAVMLVICSCDSRQALVLVEKISSIRHGIKPSRNDPEGNIQDIKKAITLDTTVATSAAIHKTTAMQWANARQIHGSHRSQAVVTGL